MSNPQVLQRPTRARQTVYRSLASLCLVLLIVPPTSAHEIQISVMGKSTRSHTIPSTLGEAFFTTFRGTSARLGDEVAYQMGQIDQSGIRLRKIHKVEVTPNLYLALDGTSSSSFAVSASGFDLTASGEFRCPVNGCHHIDIGLQLDEVEATGTFDYFNGQGALTLVPPNPQVDVNFDTNLLWSLLLALLPISINDIENLAESKAERALNRSLQTLRLEGQLPGIADILDTLPPSLISQLGVDPLVLLQNPFLGLSMDISILAPQGVSVPGKIVMSIYHSRPSVSGSVVNGSFNGGKNPRLSWAAVPGATQYRIYSQLGTTASWTYRTTTSSTSWTDGIVSHPNLANGSQGGNTYWYYVVAVNTYGVQSHQSNIVTFSDNGTCEPVFLCEQPY
ncbi:MAG: hypothetical protein AAGD06_08670 [Acidobacteriota bacterium]